MASSYSWHMEIIMALEGVICSIWAGVLLCCYHVVCFEELVTSASQTLVDPHIVSSCNDSKKAPQSTCGLFLYVPLLSLDPNIWLSQTSPETHGQHRTARFHGFTQGTNLCLALARSASLRAFLVCLLLSSVNALLYLK